ncbi:death associated protein kinase, putative [Trichomonas vaginalis G3]|uniref:Death associated protein kinase, putative n=1 Tax=Trichomonas vaginalis (strain ATCC PRA-98 / G3) TaxID=412133 RepID=A2FGM3_TRIV3|nr:ankyrin repeat protein family [Trichomonas vaginalis G3]EAX95947.1 death associated protein kinase, putative [Trichomonas vaginalis G3]KAI5492666.1 ankyrin repeat protein family [Trichomonas vaginalis G3]|eukprot:XP_001308877.1 death associated protein kinase [Trichomonas vaginalis G3]
MSLDFEYIAAHISDYINNENLFNTFDIEAIKTIMKYSRLTADQYVTLLKQSSSTLKAKELYICTRKANARIQNLEEVVSILNSVKRYMKFNIFDGIIDFLKQNVQVINNSTNKTEIFQDKTKAFQNENASENTTKDTTIKATNEKYNHSQDILTKITELKESNDFETVYKFLDELSSKGNHDMISKSIEAGLWQKIAPKKYEYDPESNVLHLANENGNLRLVQSLIECGCDKEAKNKFGYTPLICASSYGQLEVVNYLISVGADKDAKNKFGYTPLICASENGHLGVIEYLISIGADKETKNGYGYTPLIKASSNGKLDVVKYLISVGANKEAKDKYGYTPLLWASENGKLEVVQYLISVGANKEAKDNLGYTPLICASMHGHLEVVQYLISVGADKEAKNNLGYTPLIRASENDKLEVVQYLISVGANKEAKNNDGKTAMMIAKGKVRDYLKTICAN